MLFISIFVGVRYRTKYIRRRRWLIAETIPDERATRDLYPEGPLTRSEMVTMSRQIGERRERWREACMAHFADLWREHPQGILT